MVRVNFGFFSQIIIIYFRVGDVEFFENLLLEGYDHITDVIDPDDSTIVQVAQSRGHQNVAQFLEGVKEFEVSRSNSDY